MGCAKPSKEQPPAWLHLSLGLGVLPLLCLRWVGSPAEYWDSLTGAHLPCGARGRR